MWLKKAIPTGAAFALNMRPITTSLDHLIGADEQRRRHFNADRCGRLQVDEEFHIRSLLN